MRRMTAVVRIVSLYGVMVLSSGCSTMVTLDEASNSLHGAASCCDQNVALLPYDVFPGDMEVRIKLDQSSTAFEFPTGKSYFKALVMPARAIPYRMRVQSFALGEHIDKAHIFYPQIMLLDEEFEVVRQSQPADFIVKKAGFQEATAKTWGLPIKLEGYVVIDDPTIKYMVIYTTKRLMAAAEPFITTRITPIILPGIVTAIPIGTQLIEIPHSPYGLLYLSLDPQ